MDLTINAQIRPRRAKNGREIVLAGIAAGRQHAVKAFARLGGHFSQLQAQDPALTVACHELVKTKWQCQWFRAKKENQDARHACFHNQQNSFPSPVPKSPSSKTCRHQSSANAQSLKIAGATFAPPASDRTARFTKSASRVTKSSQPSLNA